MAVRLRAPRGNSSKAGGLGSDPGRVSAGRAARGGFSGETSAPNLAGACSLSFDRALCDLLPIEPSNQSLE